MIEIDGAAGEGGGQILRTSLSLALITGREFRLKNIRARRPKPGLQPQHLMCVRAAASIGQAQAQGDALHSQELVFQPGHVTPGAYHFAIGTAGATSLVLHTVYLPLMWRASAPSQVVLTGGTHVTASPSFHFLESTWTGYLSVLGLSVRVQMRRPGFYPRGGGVLEAHLQPCRQIDSLQIDRITAGNEVQGRSIVAGLPSSIAGRQARRALTRLRELRIRASVAEESWDGGPGTILNLTLNTRPVPTLFFGLGARGKPAERVADEAVDQVEQYLAAEPPAVDAHSADQLVLPLALAPGASTFPVAQVSSHLLTNVDVIRQFVEREITCEGPEGHPGRVTIAA